MEDGVALGKELGHPVVLVEAGNRGLAAGLGEEPGQAGHNKVPGPGIHSLLVPADHKIPSVGRMACHSCLLGYVLAFPLDTVEDLEDHNPGQGNQAPVVDLWEVPAATVDCMDCLLRMVALSFSPLDPWDREAGF